MNKQQALEVLKAHNEWRRDKGDTKNLTMHEPKVIGEAIDVAIAALSDAVTLPDGWIAVPVEPTAEMIKSLVISEYPNDVEKGKQLQSLRGCDVVPPNFECEEAVGKYYRMLQAAPTCEKES